MTTHWIASRITQLPHSMTAVMILVGLGLVALPVQAATQQVPWECSNYSDEAQTRCLNAYIERQREQIGKLEGQLQAQQEMVGQLNRQGTVGGQIQPPLTQPPVTTAVVPVPYAYPYVYGYPAVGIGLYFGRPWIYGPGFYGYYGRPFWGPRHYGHWGRRW